MSQRNLLMSEESTHSGWSTPTSQRRLPKLSPPLPGTPTHSSLSRPTSSDGPGEANTVPALSPAPPSGVPPSDATLSLAAPPTTTGANTTSSNTNTNTNTNTTSATVMSTSASAPLSPASTAPPHPTVDTSGGPASRSSSSPSLHNQVAKARAASTASVRSANMSALFDNYEGASNNTPVVGFAENTPRGSVDTTPDMSQKELELDERSWWSFITAVFAWRGTVFTAIWPQLIFSVLVATIVVLVHRNLTEKIAIGSGAHVVVGSICALGLVFRTNISHQRYNEARLLLSKVKNAMRSIMLLVATVPFPQAKPPEWFHEDCKDLLLQFQLLFSAMVDDLRSREEVPDDPNERPAPMPRSINYIGPQKRSLRRITRKIIRARRDHDPSHLYKRYPPHLRPVILAGETIRILQDFKSTPEASRGFLPASTVMYATQLLHDQVLSSWESMVRIVTSPAPFVYRHALAVMVLLYVTSAPFAFVDTLGWATIPAEFMLSFAFNGMLRLALELENPLGWDINDVDMTGFHEQIASDLTCIHIHTFGVDLEAEPHPHHAPSPGPALGEVVLDVLSAAKVQRKKTKPITSSNFRRRVAAAATANVGGVGMRVGGGAMLSPVVSGESEHKEDVGGHHHSRMHEEMGEELNDGLDMGVDMA